MSTRSFPLILCRSLFFFLSLYFIFPAIIICAEEGGGLSRGTDLDDRGFVSDGSPIINKERNNFTIHGSFDGMDNTELLNAAEGSTLLDGSAHSDDIVATNPLVLDVFAAAEESHHGRRNYFHQRALVVRVALHHVVVHSGLGCISPSRCLPSETRRCDIGGITGHHWCTVSDNCWRCCRRRTS